MERQLKVTSEYKTIEIVQRNKEPINPSCYSFYQPAENDKLNTLPI
jgi:hypothetical protein